MCLVSLWRIDSIGRMSLSLWLVLMSLKIITNQSVCDVAEIERDKNEIEIESHPFMYVSVIQNGKDVRTHVLHLIKSNDDLFSF